MLDDSERQCFAGVSAPYPPKSRSLLAAFVLFVAYLLAFADRTVVALLVVPIEHDLALSNVQMGLLQGTAFAIFYALFGLPIAWAVDRFNRRSIATAGIAAWSLMTALAGLSRGFIPFFLARVGVGAGEATILPTATSLLADYLPPVWRGRVLGVFASGIYLGSGLAYILGGFILHRLHGREMALPWVGAVHPWQIVLLTLALLGLPLVAVMALMPEPVRRHSRGRRQEARISLTRYLVQARSALAAHITGFTAMAFAGFAATVWLPTIFIRDYGWSAGQAGTHLGLLSIVLGPIGSCTGGFLADRLERLKRADGKLLVAALAACGAAPAAIMLGRADNAATAFAAAAFFLFFSSFLWGLAPGALQEIIHGAALGRVTAIYTALLNLIGFGLGPATVALVAKLWCHDNLGHAVALVVPVAACLAIFAFMAGRPAYRAARRRLGTI